MQTITTYGNIPVLLCSNSSKARTSLLPLVEWELQKHGKWLMVSKSFSWTSDQQRPQDGNFSSLSVQHFQVNSRISELS
jgi:hypothetical protein